MSGSWLVKREAQTESRNRTEREPGRCLVIADSPFEPEGRSFGVLQCSMSQWQILRSYANRRLRIPPKEPTGCYNLLQSRDVRTNCGALLPPWSKFQEPTIKNHVWINDTNSQVTAVIRRFGYGRVCWKYLIGRSSFEGDHPPSIRESRPEASSPRPSVCQVSDFLRHESPEDADTSENSSSEKVTIESGSMGRPDVSLPGSGRHHRISTREAVREPLSSPMKMSSDALDDQGGLESTASMN